MKWNSFFFGFVGDKVREFPGGRKRPAEEKWNDCENQQLCTAPRHPSPIRWPSFSIDFRLNGLERVGRPIRAISICKWRAGTVEVQGEHVLMIQHEQWGPKWREILYFSNLLRFGACNVSDYRHQVGRQCPQVKCVSFGLSRPCLKLRLLPQHLVSDILRVPKFFNHSVTPQTPLGHFVIRKSVIFKFK